MLCTTQIVLAQETIFSTELNAKKIGTDDVLEVTYSLKNAGNVSKFIPSAFDGFKIVAGPMQSNSVNIINGDMSSATNITYVLKPTQAGNFTIPGAKAITDAGIIKSNAVVVAIVKGSVTGSIQKQQRKRNINPFDEDEVFTNPFDDPFFKQFFNRGQRGNPNQPNSNSQTQPQKHQSAPKENITHADLQKKIFAKIDLSKSEVFLGEPVIATYNVYTQLPVSINPLMPSGSPNGFWTRDITLDPNAYKEHAHINGKEYVVIPIRKTALVPTKTGSLSLDSFVVNGSAQTNQNQTATNILEEFFGSAESEMPFEAFASKVFINVKPLPEANKPSNFSGAVGNFTIESNIDKTELTTDQTLSVNYIVKGSGNINMMGNPCVMFPQNFEAYSPKVFDTITQVNTSINGYKNYKYLLTPLQTGKVQIPAAEFCYFDLETETYKTIKSPAYQVQIKPGNNFDNMIAENKLNDIHDIENSDPVKLSFGKPLFGRLFYWALFALPIVSMLGISFAKKNKVKNANAENAKNKIAQRIAKQRLEIAEKHLQQKNYSSFYSETSKAIWLYLSDKLNIPIAKLSKQLVEQRFESLQINKELQQSVFDIINSCETALYANTNDEQNASTNFATAIKTISNLEEKLA